MIDYDPKAWLRIVVTLRGAVAGRLLGRVSVAIVLGVLAWWMHDTASFAIPPVAHTLIGAALGLLLVFRTNASYGRYVEARELLGRIVNASRDLARQVVTYVADHPECAALREDVLRWLGAFYRLLVQSVRDERDLDALGERLHASERAQLEPLKHRPAVVATWISARLHAAHRAGHLELEALRAMDANLTAIRAAHQAVHGVVLLHGPVCDCRRARGLHGGGLSGAVVCAVWDRRDRRGDRGPVWYGSQ